jgi:hypothetical protein
VWRRERREHADRPVPRSVSYADTRAHSNADTHTQSNPHAYPYPNAVPESDAHPDTDSQRVAWPVPAAVVRQSPCVPTTALKCPGFIGERLV